MFPRFHCAYICFWTLRLNQSYNECITSFYFSFIKKCYVGFFLFDFVIAFPSLVWWHFVYTMMVYSPMANYACIRIYILHLSTCAHDFISFFARDHNYLPMLDRIDGPSRFNLSQAKVPDGGKTDSKTTVLVMQPVFPLRGFLPWQSSTSRKYPISSCLW